MNTKNKQLADLIPDADLFLNLEPEELAEAILEVLVSWIEPTQESSNSFHPPEFPNKQFDKYPYEKQQALEKAVMEAWGWLEREGLVAVQPGQTGPVWYFVTRRGLEIGRSGKLKEFRMASQFPKAFLHSSVADKVWLTFVRRDFDTAVFQAFKEVEVAVREASGLPEALYGTDLMRKAFDPRSGTLRDPEQPDAEREALAHLFAGAIGSYKNPHSHRRVAIDDPAEAAEMILLASHLLWIVDARTRDSESD